jgi:hypothetical protein
MTRIYELMLRCERAHAHSGDFLGMNTYTRTRVLPQVFGRALAKPPVPKSNGELLNIGIRVRGNAHG